MTNARTDLGFGGELEEFDPAAWSPPKPKLKTDKPSKAITQQMAEAVGFKSREPQAPPMAEPKIDRRRRTGRNAQFNLKAKPETIEAFCLIADQKGWGLGEAFEQAVLLLQREISRQK
jgi:hypothetical protein